MMLGLLLLLGHTCVLHRVACACFCVGNSGGSFSCLDGVTMWGCLLVSLSFSLTHSLTHSLSTSAKCGVLLCSHVVLIVVAFVGMSDWGPCSTVVVCVLGVWMDVLDGCVVWMDACACVSINPHGRLLDCV